MHQLGRNYERVDFSRIYKTAIWTYPFCSVTSYFAMWLNTSSVQTEKMEDLEGDKIFLYIAVYYINIRIVTGFATRVTRRVPLMEQALITLRISSSDFCGILVTQSLAFCLVLCRPSFVFLFFLALHCKSLFD